MSKVEGPNKNDIHKQFIKHKDSLQKINEQQKKQIEALKEQHKARVANEDHEHLDRLRMIKEKNEQNVFGELERTDKVLARLQDKVIETKELTDKEIKDIKERAQADIARKEQKYTIQSQQKNLDFNENIREQNSKFEQEMKSFNTEQASKERQNIIEHKQGVAQTRQNHQHEYEELKKGFEKIQADREVKFQKALMKQRDQQLMQLRTESQSHLNKLEIMQNRFKNEMEKIMVDQQNKKQGLQKEFEKDYQGILKDQTQLVNNLDFRTKELIHDGKNMLAREKNNVMAKAGDEFYSANKLYPTYTDLGDSYDIMVKVPPHEKESVNIMTKDRLVRISLDRRFDETLEDNDFTNVSKKIETITSSFDVPEILNSRAKVSKAYLNGTLVFNVKKA